MFKLSDCKVGHEKKERKSGEFQFICEWKKNSAFVNYLEFKENIQERKAFFVHKDLLFYVRVSGVTLVITVIWDFSSYKRGI